MAALHPDFKTQMLRGGNGSGPDLQSSTGGEVRAMLVDRDDMSEAAFLAATTIGDLTWSSATAALGGGQTMSLGGQNVSYIVIDNTTVTDGVFNTGSDTISFLAPAADADDFEALLFAYDATWGTPANAVPIAYIDNISVSPNGQDIVVDFNASGIFAIG